MSIIAEKSKKYEKPKINKNGCLKKNLKEKSCELSKYSSVNTKSPRQKSFVMKNKIRNQKSNDINYTKKIDNEMDDMNFLLSTENDPFSHSVIYSNNKKLENNYFPSIKSKKMNDKSTKKKPKLKMLNNIRNFDDTRKRFGMARSVKNSHIRKNNRTLNISDFKGISKYKYKFIDDRIIDKNYENDIDNDEIIISNRKGYNYSNSLFNNIHISHSNSKNDDDSIYYYFEKNNKDKNDDDYLTNNNFENNKNDFCIMYIDNYENMINDDMLQLEIQLLYEKILDLQNSYHQEYDKIINQIKTNKQFISLLIYKYKDIQKKNFNLMKIKEKNNSKNNLNFFFNLQEKEHKNCISEINNKEINIWKKMLGKKYKKKMFISDHKKEIKDLFKKIVCNRYNSIKNNLNDIENKITVKIMKKHNYKVISDKNKKSHNGGTFTGNLKNKNNKIIKQKINHKVINSGGIYENSKKNYFKNNKFNHYPNSSKKKGY
jgi:hypothetical protein